MAVHSPSLHSPAALRILLHHGSHAILPTTPWGGRQGKGKDSDFQLRKQPRKARGVIQGSMVSEAEWECPPPTRVPS